MALTQMLSSMNVIDICMGRFCFKTKLADFGYLMDSWTGAIWDKVIMSINSNSKRSEMRSCNQNLSEALDLSIFGHSGPLNCLNFYYTRQCTLRMPKNRIFTFGYIWIHLVWHTFKSAVRLLEMKNCFVKWLLVPVNSNSINQIFDARSLYITPLNAHHRTSLEQTISFQTIFRSCFLVKE